MTIYKCDAVTSRKNLETAHELARAGIDFVPIPIHGKFSKEILLPILIEQIEAIMSEVKSESESATEIEFYEIGGMSVFGKLSLVCGECNENRLLAADEDTLEDGTEVIETECQSCGEKAWWDKKVIANAVISDRCERCGRSDDNCVCGMPWHHDSPDYDDDWELEF